MTTSQISASRPATEVLRWGRSMVEPLLRKTVDELSEPLRRIAGYHFGWWDQHGRPCKGDGGKAFRPALALVSGAAVGGQTRDALPAAVAVELVHNFSLLHDDVMDNDHQRRHRPTAWSLFGVPQAILAGNVLLVAAYQILATARNPAVHWLSECVQHLCAGQSSDVAFECREAVGITECEAMAAGKTGALLGESCALGALLSGGDLAQADLLRSFGSHLGLGFQFIDDLLGIWGDPEMTGKPAGADLVARKRSLPVVIAIQSGTSAGDELASLYANRQPMSAIQVARAKQLVEQAGGREWVLQRAADEFTAATDALAKGVFNPLAVAELHALATLAMRRND